MANLKINCALPPNCSKKLEDGNDAGNPIFMAVSAPNSQTVSSGSPIIWTQILEDKNSMYDSTTGIAFVPKAGLWRISARVTIGQTGMTNFPASYYQHILIISKKVPFPETPGINTRFVDFFQERFSSTVPEKQVYLSCDEVIRLEVGDNVQIQISTVTFSPTSGVVSTNISGTVCLNCFSMLWMGN